MSKDTDRLLGHAEDNDGIEEYDNPLPDWWVGMFFVTIVFAIGYTLDYHVISHRSQEARYDAEMLAAAARWPEQEAPSELAFDAETIAAGQEVFAQTCASCHGADLTGGIGPNLIDAEWIHGGAPEQVVKTITDGVSAKGMPSWGPILGPEKIARVAAFILSSGDGSAAAPALGEESQVAHASARASAPTDPLAAGAEVFAQNCASCHGADLQGLVGPNLTDAEWIHGGELEQIVRTVTHGVPEKGMIAWGPILGEEKIRLVSAWVHAKAHPE